MRHDSRFASVRRGIASAAGLSLVLSLTGCQFFRAVHITARSMLQADPDYDAIDARAQVASAQASEPWTQPEAAPGWRDFRGPSRGGEAVGIQLADAWPQDGPPLLWRRPAGATYGSLVADHGLVFALEQRRESESLVAYSAATGDEVWANSWKGEYRDAPSGNGPRSTPVLGFSTAGDSMILGLGATGILRCVDARSGSFRWQRNVLETAQSKNLEYGLTGSPLVVDGLVVLPTGVPQDGGHGLLALHVDDGSVAWRALDDAASYSSPMLGTIAGRRQILYLSATRLVGVDPASGELLWAVPWSQRNGYNCAQPMVVGPADVIVSSAYGKGAARFRIRRTNEGWSVAEVWRSARFKTRFNPAVVFEGHVYGLDEGVLACLEIESGKRVWKGGRYGYGQVLLVGSSLIVLSDEGVVARVPATPDGFSERARFQALDGLTVNIPAVAYGRLLVRNKREIACYDLSPQAVAPGPNATRTPRPLRGGR